MLVIKASTPETTSNHRIASCKMASVHKKDIELAKATTYEGAAKFLENCTVEDISLTKDAHGFVTKY